jgi:putative redox protein
MISSSTVKWVDGLHFEGTDNAGHSVIMDADLDSGGTDKGFRPTKLLMFALAGCTGMDVISILKKKHAQVTGFEINIQAESNDEYPKKFHTMHVEYVLHGKDLLEEDVKRAILLSEEKYCIVRNTLAPSVQLSSSFKINE